MRIVFVHFGKQAPKHLILNIERCMQLFPEMPVTLITDLGCRVPGIEGLEVCYYFPDEIWNEVESVLTHPKEFRENFWLTSLTRFIALEYFMQRCNEEVLHVESDVILAKDFPFDRFSMLKKKVAFPVLSPTQGIASILYIQDYDSAHELVKLCLDLVRQNSRTTDMLVLRKFYDSNPNLVQALPIGPAELEVYRDFMDEKLLQEMKIGERHFGGIFDGLDIGCFIYGIDPRNHRGMKVVRKENLTYYLQVTKTFIEYSPKRGFLNITASNQRPYLPIFSMHIHSKNLKIFKMSKSEKFIMEGAKDQYLPQSTEFIPRVFVKSLITSIKRRSKLLSSLLKNFFVFRHPE